MATVTFNPNGVTIATERLRLQPATPSLLNEYTQLFGNPKVMEKFAEGAVKTQAFVSARLHLWASRWKEGDPYSGLAVFRKDTGQFIGHAVMGHGEAPGESEAGCLFVPEEWNKGYATEIVQAFLHHYLPRLITREMLTQKFFLEDEPLTKVRVTARVDNVASNALVKKACGESCKKEMKYGGERHHYVYDVRYMGPQNPIVAQLGKPLAECSMQELVAWQKQQ